MSLEIIDADPSGRNPASSCPPGRSVGSLWRFLAIAAYEADVAAAQAVPFVAAHLAQWRQPEDFGFVAERDARAIGAAWARQFTSEEEPAFYVDARTPEVTIGVAPDGRGQGMRPRLPAAC